MLLDTTVHSFLFGSVYIGINCFSPHNIFKMVVYYYITIVVLSFLLLIPSFPTSFLLSAILFYTILYHFILYYIILQMY
jgi:hypothetical protein